MNYHRPAPGRQSTTHSICLVLDKINKMYENGVDPVTEKSEDRRSKRSEQAMIDALIALMDNRSYDSISIKEIVEKANVGRATFYAHYQSKDDLLKDGFERILAFTLEHIVFSKDEKNLSVNVTSLFQHAAGHYHLYKNLMRGTGFGILTKDELQILSEKLQLKISAYFPDEANRSVQIPVLCHFFAGNLLLMLKWWLDHKMPFPPEKMNDLFQLLVMPGMIDALNLPHK